MYNRVNSCNDCPLSFGLECSHPNLKVNNAVISKGAESPEWCPLRKGSLTIALVLPVVLEDNCHWCKKKFDGVNVVRYNSESNTCHDCESELPF
jgi:hypothetical protein